MKRYLHLAADLAANLFLPWLAYVLAAPRYGEVGALIVSSVPPLLAGLAELAWHRRLDALSALVLGGIGLSLLAMLLGGDARLLLVRESLISGLIGVAFLGSLAFKRPLVYYLAQATVQRQQGGTGTEHFQRWRQTEHGHHTLEQITLVWGMALVGEAVMRSWLAWHWAPQRFLALAPIFSYGLAAGLGLWTFCYVRRQSRPAPKG